MGQATRLSQDPTGTHPLHAGTRWFRFLKEEEEEEKKNAEGRRHDCRSRMLMLRTADIQYEKRLCVLKNLQQLS